MPALDYRIYVYAKVVCRNLQPRNDEERAERQELRFVWESVDIRRMTVFTKVLVDLPYILPVPFIFETESQYANCNEYVIALRGLARRMKKIDEGPILRRIAKRPIGDVDPSAFDFKCDSSWADINVPIAEVVAPQLQTLHT